MIQNGQCVIQEGQCVIQEGQCDTERSVCDTGGMSAVPDHPVTLQLSHQYQLLVLGYRSVMQTHTISSSFIILNTRRNDCTEHKYKVA